jgi:hypothetical protein
MSNTLHIGHEISFWSSTTDGQPTLLACSTFMLNRAWRFASSNEAAGHAGRSVATGKVPAEEADKDRPMRG